MLMWTLVHPANNSNGFFHGTLEADAITVNGAALTASATTDATNASNIASELLQLLE